MFKKVNPKQNFPEMEREIMEYWKRDKTFEKSVNDGEKKSEYSFFDGPPFATGLPHYGHVVASLMKDVVPRYWTMRGYRVERRWGWDCHGLPIENLVEKEHDIKNKQDIEKWGVDKFNEACHNSVLRYADEWKKFIPRIGRWVDMDNDYRTMDWKYTESIWWVFSELYKKGLIYEGNKSMHICPRCETTLSNFEVTQGYKTVKDFSVIAKFKIANQDFLKKYCGGKPTSFLAWTTTPWSIPTTMALAIGADLDYVVVKIGEERIICVKERLDYVLEKGKTDKFEIINELKGKEMEHISYVHPFEKFYKDHEEVKNNSKVYQTHFTDYVSTEDGTGIVTINGAFGEIDMEAAKKIGLPIVVNVKMDGAFTSEMGEFAGMKVKSIEDSQKTDVEIIKFLAHGGTLFAKEKYEHSYPHCWRCDTPLINYATSSWFVKVTAIKDKMIKNNKEIKWVPEYIKEGRFGKWLSEARDWAVSRSRFWGAPLPVWKCAECQEKIVMGSIDELRKNTNGKITKFIFIRHGESGKNLDEVKSDSIDKYPLTKDGIGHAKRAAKGLKDKKIDIIITSPVLRTRQTAEIIGKELKAKVMKDDLIMEYRYGSWNDKSSKYLLENDELYRKYKKITDLEEKYNFVLGGSGESRAQMEARIKKFINLCLEKYSGKNILVVSHGGLNATFKRVLSGILIADYFIAQNALGYCESEVYYVDENGKEFNMHKPNIDKIKAKCPKCAGEAEIVGDVFDCWFESGSMPYAQYHYPFENADKFKKSFPADFIAEGLDQTRGWF
ncbi:MAG: class I tRNA ligase family protein, partial [Minisyncoccia bacterium]